MKNRICTAIVNSDLRAIKEVEPFSDMFELRIDLVGDGWQNVARHITKPWIACVRSRREGGHWQGPDSKRTETLLSAADLGASIIDVELESVPSAETIDLIKQKAKCLISFHDIKVTAPLDDLKEIVHRQMESGADICKVVTTAREFSDNLTTLKLIADFPGINIVSFAMGSEGVVSRILCPLVGGYLTYAATDSGNESAPGQITVAQLQKIYEMVVI